MVERFFTPQQANELLPVIKNIISGIIAQANEARLLLDGKDPSGKNQQRLIELDERIKALMGKLEDLGCYYKDWSFEVGLVDFPAIIHGQEALLCWRTDEPAVSWYHGYEDGYAGRRPVTAGLIFS